jgi:hypothetical protein
MFFDEPYSHECMDCMHKDDVMCDIKYWLRAVLDQLFGLEPFSKEDLSRYLNELTLQLGMDFPKIDLSVEMPDPTRILIDEWKAFNNDYLKLYAKTGT